MRKVDRRLTPAQQQLAADNMGLVYKIVGKWRSSGIDEDDLISIGHEVLMDAARLFNPKHGAKFSTYACRGMVLRFSRHLRGIQSRDSVAKMKSCDPLNMVRYTVLDWNKDPEFLTKELIEIGMSALNRQQARVIKMRFMEGKTLKEAGEVLGCTKERVRQVQMRALEVMRCAIQQPSSRSQRVK